MVEVSAQADVLVDAEHVGHHAHVLCGRRARAARRARREQRRALHLELLRAVGGRRAAGHRYGKVTSFRKNISLLSSTNIN